MKASNIEELKSVLGENGKVRYDIPETSKLTQEELAGITLNSIQRILSGEYVESQLED